ncbi:MAG: transcriptional repressor NrdR [Actinomycetota bacterium]|jgi:transcriptional repressor NrdR
MAAPSTATVFSVRCVVCRHEDTKVVDSRTAEDGAAIRRRRECPACLHRFTTFERMDEVPLMVAKTHGGREPFDRSKLISGVMAAAKGRPIDEDAVNALADSVEEELRNAGGSEVSTSRIGLAVLERLKNLDEVAYIRFASVYKNFDAAEDFQREAALLDKSPVG